MSRPSNNETARQQTIQIDEERRLDPAAIFGIFWRRLRMILLVVAICTVGTGLMATRIPPVYTAVSTIVVEQTETQLVDINGVLQESPMSQTVLQTLLDLIKSRSFGGTVVRELDLTQDPEFNPYLVVERPVNEQPEWVGLGARISAFFDIHPSWRSMIADLYRALPDSIEDRIAALARPLGLQLPHSVDDDEPAPEPDEVMGRTVDQLLAHLNVEQSGRGYAYFIRAQSVSAEKAARIANEVAQLYLDWWIGLKRSSTASAVERLERRVVELRADVEDKNRRLTAYKQEHQLADNPQDDPLRLQMVRLNGELIEARVFRSAADAKLNQARGLLNKSNAAAATVVNSPLLSSLRDNEASVLRDMAELKTTYDSRHPKIANKQAQIDTIQQKMNIEVDRIVQDLANESRVAHVREAQLESELQTLKQQLSDQTGPSTAANDLQQELETDRTLYADSVSRLKNLRGQQESLQLAGRVVSQADVPASPSFPRPKLMIGVAFAGSLLFALMLAFALDGFDVRLKTTRQVSQALGLRSVACVPKPTRMMRRKWRPLAYLADKPSSVFSEALHGLFMSCVLKRTNTGAQVVVVTSSLPGEGKTTLALSLATTAARHGRKAVILDLDLHRSSVASRAGSNIRTVPLAACLRGDCTVNDLLAGAETVNGLAVLANAPRAQPDAAILMMSPRMRELINGLRSRYDFIVIDTPPLLAVNDTKLLGRFADTILFVVRWARTKRDAAQAAFNELAPPASTTVIGVLNQINLRRYARGQYGGGIQYYQSHSHYYAN